jgi:hypothetical protein
MKIVVNKLSMNKGVLQTAALHQQVYAPQPLGSDQAKAALDEGHVLDYTPFPRATHSSGPPARVASPLNS